MKKRGERRKQRKCEGEGGLGGRRVGRQQGKARRNESYLFEGGGRRENDPTQLLPGQGDDKNEMRAQRNEIKES